MFDTMIAANIREEIQHQGYSIVPAGQIPLAEALRSAWQALRADYESLPPDEFLPEHASYRYRRYDSFYFYPKTGELALLPHRDYFQSQDINAVTGGMLRRFAPLTGETIHNPFLHALIRYDFEQFPLRQAAQYYYPWQVDVHQILVVAEPHSEAHPTPEGVHQDGAEFVTVHLAVLDNAQGGVVTVYDEHQHALQSFQLAQVLDSYLFDDTSLWHGVTPIISADGLNPAVRGILTFDFHYRPNLSHAG